MSSSIVGPTAKANAAIHSSENGAPSPDRTRSRRRPGGRRCGPPIADTGDDEAINAGETFLDFEKNFDLALAGSSGNAQQVQPDDPNTVAVEIGF